MRTSFRLRALAGTAALAAALTATPAFAGPASMGGTITDAATGEPVADVCVLVWRDFGDSAWEQYPESCTEADGRWSYTGLEPGTYYVEAKGGGYVRQYAYGQNHSWGATRFDLADDDSVTVDLAMEAGGTIAGTVTDAATGEPAAGVCVSAQLDDTWGDACTDETGHYEMTGLKPGDGWRLYFSDWSEGRYLTEYAHDAKDWDAAATFAVVAGETTTVDEDMTPAASVSGTVTDAATGAPLGGVCVNAMADPSTFESQGFACTDAEGAYRMSPMPAGTYHVVVEDESAAHPRTWHPSATSFADSQTVTVGDGEALAGIDVVMSPAAYVTGTVTSAVTGLPLAGVCASGVTPSGEWHRWGGHATCSDENGRYTLGGLPTGDVKVYFNPTDGLHMPQWANGQETEAAATVFPAVGGETIEGVDAALVEGGRIAGRVTDARTKKPVEGACVTVGVFSHRSGENGTQWPSVCTGADGRYELRGLPTGAYQVEFYDPDGAWAWQFFPGKADRVQAAKLQVTAGQTLSGINAKLSPGGTIEGVVRDGATGEPAEGVCMDPYTARGSLSFGTGWCTGPDGRYVLRGLPTTNVKIQFFGDGYVPEWAFDAETFEDAAAVATTGGATTTIRDVVVDKYEH